MKQEKYNLIDETFESKTLSKFFKKLDKEILCMEELVEWQEAKIKELQKEADLELNRKVQDGNKMIAQTLMACIGTPTTDSLTPAAATMLAKIRDMDNVEDIRDYINSIKTN